MTTSTRPAGAHAAAPEPRTGPGPVLVVVPHLGAGGTQRIVSLLVNHWAEQGREVAVLTLFAEPDAHRLHPGAIRSDFEREPADTSAGSELRQLNYRMDAALQRRTTAGSGWRHAVWAAAWRAYRAARDGLVIGVTSTSPALMERLVGGSRRVVWLRQKFEALRPTAIISFLGSTNIQTILAARGLCIPVLISERNDPALQHLGQPWQTLRERIYPRADLVTANSIGAVATMSRWMAADKLRRVVNPLVIPACPKGLSRRGPRFVTVARLVEQKGVDLLLDAFARIATTAPEWQLDLVGDGPLRGQLQARAARLGLSGRVTFHGHQSDPFPFLYAAGVFVLPSRFEGMPNAMLEAMGVGLAIITSDASPGPLELIRDGETGLVFPSGDAAALAAAMRRLAADQALREALGTAAERLAEDMALPRVAADWDAAIDQARALHDAAADALA